MASLRTQVESFKGGFYVLEAPQNTKERTVYWGELVESAPAGSFHSFDLKTKKLCGPPHRMSLHQQDVAFSSPSYVWSLGNFEDYKARFLKAHPYLDLEEIQKAVLYTKAKASTAGFIKKTDFLNLLLQAFEKKDSGYLFAFYDPKDESALLGLSPEYIFLTQGETVQTVAVAGTKSQGPWTDKLLKEQALVQEGINQSLGQDIKWSSPKDMTYANLQHLRSVGSFLKTQTQIEDLSSRLHPTAAVGTLPKEAWRKLDLGEEGRGFFGGYAELTQISAPFSLVTIRAMEWRSSQVQVCIGGGVVKESDLDEEWKELENKFSTFKSIWGFE